MQSFNWLCEIGSLETSWKVCKTIRVRTEAGNIRGGFLRAHLFLGAELVGRGAWAGLVKPLDALQTKPLGHRARQSGCADGVVEIVYQTEGGPEGPVTSHPDLGNPFCKRHPWGSGTIQGCVYVCAFPPQVPGVRGLRFEVCPFFLAYDLGPVP